jgi:hypothetical protein
LQRLSGCQLTNRLVDVAIRHAAPLSDTSTGPRGTAKTMGVAAAEPDHRPGDRLPTGESRQSSAARSLARPQHRGRDPIGQLGGFANHRIGLGDIRGVAEPAQPPPDDALWRVRWSSPLAKTTWKTRVLRRFVKKCSPAIAS